jgi:hypothetical protein
MARETSSGEMCKKRVRIEGCSFHHANVHEQNTRDGWKTVFGICLEYHWTKPHNKIGFATWFEISLQAARVHILLIQLFFFRVRDKEDASFTFDSGCFTIYSSLFITSDSIFFWNRNLSPVCLCIMDVMVKAKKTCNWSRLKIGAETYGLQWILNLWITKGLLSQLKRA